MRVVRRRPAGANAALNLLAAAGLRFGSGSLIPGQLW